MNCKYLACMLLENTGLYDLFVSQSRDTLHVGPGDRARKRPVAIENLGTCRGGILRARLRVATEGAFVESEIPEDLCRWLHAFRIPQIGISLGKRLSPLASLGSGARMAIWQWEAAHLACGAAPTDFNGWGM